MELHAKFAKPVNLDVHNSIRQTELRNTVFEHTADFVQRLEDMYFIAVFGSIASESQTCRTGTYHGYLGAVKLSAWLFGSGDTLVRVVGAKTLEITDGHCRVFHLQVNTIRLTLFLLRAYTTAHRWQRRTLLDDGSRTENITRFQFLDETGDVNIHRTTLYAGRVLAVQAAMALHDSLLEGQTLVHLLVQTLHTHFRTQLRHLHTLNRRTVFGCAGERSNPSRPPLMGGDRFIVGTLFSLP